VAPPHLDMQVKNIEYRAGKPLFTRAPMFFLCAFPTNAR